MTKDSQEQNDLETIKDSFTGFETKILDKFVDFFCEKYNPTTCINNYAEFLKIVSNMVMDTRAEFEEKYVKEIDEKEFGEGR